MSAQKYKMTTGPVQLTRKWFYVKFSKDIEIIGRYHIRCKLDMEKHLVELEIVKWVTMWNCKINFYNENIKPVWNQ